MEPAFFTPDDHANVVLLIYKPQPASMEPAFFTPDDPTAPRRRLHFGLASMEPAFFTPDDTTLSMRIPAKLNADSEDAERGFRASRTQLGA